MKLDIEQLRLTEEELDALSMSWDVVDAQLAKALWGLVDHIECAQTKNECLRCNLKELLKAAGIPAPTQPFTQETTYAYGEANYYGVPSVYEQLFGSVQELC